MDKTKLTYKVARKTYVSNWSSLDNWLYKSSTLIHKLDICEINTIFFLVFVTFFKFFILKSATKKRYESYIYYSDCFYSFDYFIDIYILYNLVKNYICRYNRNKYKIQNNI